MVAMGFMGPVACASPSFQPPRLTAALRAEQERVAPLIEKSQRAGFTGTQGSCAVRMLGTRGGATFVWADCAFPDADGGPGGGVSAPVRVDGNAVQFPGDGSDFAKDVRRMFPHAMVDTILHDPDRLRP